MQRMRRVGVGQGSGRAKGAAAAAALGALLWSGLSWGEPRVAEIGRITVDGDKAQLSGDIEVGGELVGSWEMVIRRVEAKSDELVLVGRMTGILETGSAVLKESVDEVRVSLSDPQAVCGELSASASELRFERLGLVIYNLDREADVSARTARGRALTSLLCAASHVIDGQDAGLLPALSTVAALANRELHAIAPAGGAPRRAAAQTAAAAAPTSTQAPTITIAPVAAQGISASDPAPGSADAATITVTAPPRRASGPRLPRLPRAQKPAAVGADDPAVTAPAAPIELTPIEP